jgi:aldehyde:ferredoxin oxidoreductase
MNAVTGKILWVNLTEGTCTPEAVPGSVYERFLSGLGLAAYYLYQRIPPGADPLGPDNVLAFASGLLTGTGSLMTGRWMVAAKSPLTGTWGDSNCGGDLSPAIKQSGYDAIFFTGISPKPVYLSVKDGVAELVDAADLWGLDTRHTEKRLLQHRSRSSAAACIGPAGEKMSLLAGIVNDQGRLAARSGLGAVMGSKKLKAIVLGGNTRPSARHPREMKRLSQNFSKWVMFQPVFLSGRLFQWFGTFMAWLPWQLRFDGMLYKILLRKWGTTSMNQVGIEIGDAPIKNWGGSNLDFRPAKSRVIDPDRILAHQKERYACYGCPLGCGGRCMVKDKIKDMHKPEYETVIAWTTLTMNKDLESVFLINEMLNLAGMDALSAGATAAFAIECYENGLLTKADTQGLELTWGNTQAIVKLAEMMVSRQGIGDLLADGTKKAAERIGRDAQRYAMHAGGQELPMHDGRADPGFILHAVVEPTPGRHTLGSYTYYDMFQLWTRVKSLPKAGPRFYPKGQKFLADHEKVVWSAACSQFSQVMNGAGMCMFGGFIGVNRIPIFEWLNAATGWDKSPEEYMRIGWNIQTLRQAFNAREGIPLRHSINARAVGIPPQTEGVNKGRALPLDELVPAYWAEMGWDPQTGAPGADALQALGALWEKPWYLTR